jgi:hypothetical protein
MKKLFSQGIIVAMLILSAVFAAAPSPAAAAVTCSGDACSGKDPQSSGCAADAYTVAHNFIPGTSTIVEIRWSQACQTNWARVGLVTSNVKAVQQTGYTQGYSSNNGSASWSKMIYSPVLCVKALAWGNWGTTSTSCV